MHLIECLRHFAALGGHEHVCEVLQQTQLSMHTFYWELHHVSLNFLLLRIEHGAADVDCRDCSTK